MSQISLQPDWQIGNGIFNRPIKGLYSNPGAQVGTYNKDFDTVLQTDLTRSLVPLVAQANQICDLQKINNMVNLAT